MKKLLYTLGQHIQMDIQRQMSLQISVIFFTYDDKCLYKYLLFFSGDIDFAIQRGLQEHESMR